MLRYVLYVFATYQNHGQIVHGSNSDILDNYSEFTVNIPSFTTIFLIAGRKFKVHFVVNRDFDERMSIINSKIFELLKNYFETQVSEYF